MFLVGARRSGTNWLQRIICAHPDAIAIPSETHLFSHGLAPLADRFQHGSVASPKTAKVYLPQDAMRDMLRDVADRVFLGVATRLDPGAKLIVERTPWHAYHLDLIGDVYPDAAVIHLVRDGRDVARSLVSQEWGPTTMAEAAEEWRSAVEAARAAGARLERYREVRYEAILVDPQANIGDLYRWLSLDDSAKAIAQGLLEAGVHFNTDARNSSVISGKWRSGVSAHDLRAFERVGGRLSDELGYERDQAPSRPGGLLSATRSWVSKARRRGEGPTRPATVPSSAGMPRLDRPYEPRVTSVARMEQIQDLLDRFVGAFLLGDTRTVDSLLGAGALVRRSSGDLDERGRDATARQRLLDAIAAAGASRSSHPDSETYPGEPTSVALLRCVDASGHASLETLVLGIAGGVIDRLAWYQVGPSEGAFPGSPL